MSTAYPTEVAGPNEDPATDFQSGPVHHAEPLAWSDYDEATTDPVWTEPHRSILAPVLTALGIGAVAVAGAYLLAGHPAEHAHPNSSPVTTTLAPAAPTPSAEAPAPQVPHDDGDRSWNTGPTMADPPDVHTVQPPAPVETADARFVRVLNAEGWLVTDPAAAESAGHQACAVLAETRSLPATERWVNSTLGIYEPNAHVLTVTAAAVYCPGLT